VTCAPIFAIFDWFAQLITLYGSIRQQNIIQLGVCKI